LEEVQVDSISGAGCDFLPHGLVNLPVNVFFKGREAEDQLAKIVPQSINDPTNGHKTDS
jgi:hypothetical protein